MQERLFCLALGYALGSFLTAEVVTRAAAGKRPAQLGTGNPGMANVAAQLGLKAGLAVLAGDLAKTAAACALARALWPGGGALAALYTGLGAAAGHNWPAWNRFRGGKGVAVTCAALVLAAPGWGLLADALGGAVVLCTGWLPLGAAVIPLAFVPMAFAALGGEAGALALALAALMLARHRRGLRRILRGQEARTMQLFFKK